MPRAKKSNYATVIPFTRLMTPGSRIYAHGHTHIHAHTYSHTVRAHTLRATHTGLTGLIEYLYEEDLICAELRAGSHRRQRLLCERFAN